MVGTPMEADHKISSGVDPIDAVVFVVDASGVPEPDLQSFSLRIIGVTQKRGRINIREQLLARVFLDERPDLLEEQLGIVQLIARGLAGLDAAQLPQSTSAWSSSLVVL